MGEVVDIIITRGGRFLIRCDKDKVGEGWFDGGVKQGKKKTGHALRDALRGRVKCISEIRAKNSDRSSFSPQHAMIPPAFPPPLPHPYNTPLPASLPSLEENHSFLSDDDIFSEYRDDVKNESKAGIKVEPEREWRRNGEIDNDLKNDLLNFFVTTESTDDRMHRSQHRSHYG